MDKIRIILSKLSNKYLIVVLATILSILVLQLSPFVFLNNLIIDQFHGSISARKEIVIIGIDDKSLKELGGWPWTRDRYAEILHKIKAKKPSVIGVDILLADAQHAKYDLDLQNELRDSDIPVVLASKLLGNEVTLPYFSGKNVKYAFANYATDENGKIRSAYMYAKVLGECNKSFVLSILNEYFGNDSDMALCDSDTVKLHKQFSIPRKYNFVYTKEKFIYYSFSDIFNPSNDLENVDLKDKIVLIGVTTNDLKSELRDNLTDVFGEQTPGIVIHANVINSILQTKSLTNLPWYWIYPVLFCFVLLTYTLLLRTKNHLVEILLVGAILLINNVVGVIIFDFGLIWPFVDTNIMIALTFFLSLARKYLTERKEKTFIVSAFRRYVSPKLLKELIKDPDKLTLGGERKEMTVMFSDIRGFTTMTEGMDPHDLIVFLNEYLDAMSEIILRNGGTIDKYIGDAIMAFWNAPLNDPEHRKNALSAALEMSKKMVDFSNIKIGIGLNTGQMSVGNIGSSKRFDYTVIGDNVNLASRIEGLTKKYGVNLLVTDSVIAGIGDSDMIFRKIDEIVVKGKSTAVKIYQPMRNSSANVALCAKYEEAFKRYRTGEFKEAKKLFSQIDSDMPSELMIDRIDNYTPAAGWDGIWKWEEK